MEPGNDAAEALRRTLAYHERTKHHPRRYARSPGGLDWANQPDPFRTYAGAPAIDLPLLADGLATPYDDLYRPGAVAPRPIDRDGVALLFELAFGLSAWKESRGSRWALRCSPSSGNLHPTEAYAILPDRPGLPAGVYHYESRDHRLGRRGALAGEAASRLDAAMPGGAFLVGLSTIAWRESWKYGERAFRYCQLDAGHALAAVRYAAGALGWTAALLDAAADDDIEAWLGLDRDADSPGLDPDDRERPLAALLVGPPPLPAGLDPRELTAILRAATWAGRANRLSPDHVRWEAIEDVDAATRKPPTSPMPPSAPPARPPLSPASRTPASTIIRGRRSAVAFDGRTSIDATVFYAMLDRLLPRPGVPPWDVLPWGPMLHPAPFVHRVRGLAPGLYLLDRSGAARGRWRDSTRAAFDWRRPPGCPEHLPLSLLAGRDLRDASRIASCHQEIAADGAFSLAMIADFGETLRDRGPWWYRALHWEAGVLGHVLYLEAEAAGVRGTGMGCYFDDLAHDLLGLGDDRFQDLYHFTAGGPVEDRRLATLPPYAHLRRAATGP